MALAVKKDRKSSVSKSSIKKAIDKRKEVASKKVIDFFKLKAKTKKNPLTDAQKEELVIEFRTKARKLARSVLRKWHARLDLQELDSIVDLSLCEAVKKFDPAMGASFMTFLFYHLKGNLIRSITIAAEARGYGLAEELRFNDQMYYIGGEAINSYEVAEALIGTENEAPDEALMKKELIGLSQKARTKLDKIEDQIIERLFIAQEPLLDIADSLGYSRCHISRVKQRALDILKNDIEASLADNQEEVETVEIKKIYRRKPRSKAIRIRNEKCKIKQMAA
jgi:RNA polymerase sigma factor (sigma-70 family)